MSEQRISALYYFIPGALDLKHRKLLSALLFFIFSAIPLCLIISKLDLFVNGLESFVLSAFLLVAKFDRLQRLFNPDVIEFWVASLFLVFWLVCLFALNRMHIKKYYVHENLRPLWATTYSKFKKNRMARILLVGLCLAYATALLCPFLAPDDPNSQQDIIVTRYLPPLRSAAFLRLKQLPYDGPQRDGPDFVSSAVYYLGATNRALLYRNPEIIFVSTYQIKGTEVHYAQGSRRSMIQTSALISDREDEFAGKKLYLLGSDKYGRDILSRIIYGSRISLTIGLLATLIAVTFGVIIGATSGYFGRKTDSILMRAVDLILAFPNLFLILMILSLFGNSILLIIVILGLTGWMGVSRIVRGQILSLKEQEFIQAAHALGFSHARIIFRHLIPNTFAQVIVAATLRLGGIILVEAGLSFLGVGVQPPTASWGNMVSEGRDTLIHAWWISTFPGLAIVATVTCFNVIGDGLRDALDPRLGN